MVKSAETKTIDSLPPLRDTISQFGLRAEKSLGQHFLLDLNVTRKIARMAAPLDQCPIVEIGPGPGGLTRALFLEGANNVMAVEKDHRCIEALRQIAMHTPSTLSVYNQDALEISMAAVGQPVKIVANLPYNISTVLLVQWLHEIYSTPGCIIDMVLMFQREVAERIYAEPGTKDYGRVSILTQWLCDAKPLLHLPPQAFTPPPKVESTVVRITPRAKPLFPADIAHLERITKAAFGQRRKMLRVAMKQIWPDAESQLAARGIDPTARAEDLDIMDFGKLAD